ncbi:hypothetical protein GCM10012280_01380 [Wenjunlia tyrosinilytica]|uniref:Uncharacterized protein n=1 Tax=Wenjunlia tyrosinilytica TaxID=1544741 RepID=A0A917ZE44_9ACTN|nr:hypothetical protein GCM10012280_01380 [Wenjunlia tyrosinilytica]
MAKNGVTAAELAEDVNDAILRLTGRRGEVGEHTVWRWLAGENQWPHERQRAALEQVTGCTAEALGFVRRGARVSPPAHEEDPLRRRTFLAAAGAAAAIGTGPPQRVGTADVDRLERWTR